MARAARSGLLAPLGLYAEKLAPRGDGGSQRRGRRSEALSDRWPPTPTPTRGGRPRHSAGGWALSRGFVRRGLAGSPQSFSLRPWLQPFRARSPELEAKQPGLSAEGPGPRGLQRPGRIQDPVETVQLGALTAPSPARTDRSAPRSLPGPAHGEHARGPGQSPNPFHPNPQRLLGEGSMPALGFSERGPAAAQSVCFPACRDCVVMICFGSWAVK